MTEERARGLLALARDQVKRGIYAIRHKDYLELCNMPMSKTQAKKKKRELKGIKVYYV